MSALAAAPAPAPPLDFSAPIDPSHGVRSRDVLRRLAANLTVACAVPALLIYVMLQTVGVVPAVLSALAWTYGATAWRHLTGRPTSGLLLLTVLVLTMRTAFTLATGTTYVYFLEPIVTDAVVAVTFLLSLASSRPLAARVAADFYPLSAELARTPRVCRLLRRLTLLWAGVGLLKAGLGLWLLESLPAADFVLVKTTAVLALTVVAAALSVRAALAVLRLEAVPAVCG